MARKSDGYFWELQLRRGSGDPRRSTHPTLDEAKRSAAAWMFAEPEEIEWEQESETRVIGALGGVTAEIGRFPRQAVDQPVQRRRL